MAERTCAFGVGPHKFLSTVKTIHDTARLGLVGEGDEISLLPYDVNRVHQVSGAVVEFPDLLLESLHFFKH